VVDLLKEYAYSHDEDEVTICLEWLVGRSFYHTLVYQVIMLCIVYGVALILSWPVRALSRVLV
jgi:hypothetical protein